MGGTRAKSRMESYLADRGASVKVTGAYYLSGREHVDYDTTQEHAAPDTTSDLAFKGVLADRSRAVWRGVIRVDRGAQKTDAYQENRNLLLSPDAQATPIPGLEIEANDVRCTHGATVGQVDEQHLFYLMSRGLTRADAQRAIVRGFFEPVLARIALGAGARLARRRSRRAYRITLQLAHGSVLHGADVLVALLGRRSRRACGVVRPHADARHFESSATATAGFGSPPAMHAVDYAHPRAPDRRGNGAPVGRVPRRIGVGDPIASDEPRSARAIGTTGTRTCRPRRGTRRRGRDRPSLLRRSEARPHRVRRREGARLHCEPWR